MCANETKWLGPQLQRGLQLVFILGRQRISLIQTGIPERQITRRQQKTVIMRTLVFIFLLEMVDMSISQRYSPFQWLSQLRGRRQNAGLQSEAVDCPLECDCPTAYPTALYCHSRNLQHIPYVPSHIKYVYLQHNQITGIQDGVFDNATNLVWVILSHNRLSSEKISNSVFVKLRSLDRLYLDNNELTHVPRNLPRSLTDLRLSYNKIKNISSKLFESMRNLTILQLQGNVIEEVEGGLMGLKSLMMLDMSKNKLKKIPNSFPKELQQLYLQHNKIESVPVGFLTMYPNLQFIRLSHNSLTDEGLPSNVFNTSTLVELDLSFNKLEKIPLVSRNLENLYLQANKIKEFSLSSFCDTIDATNFSKLKVLRLDANKISIRDIPVEAAYCLRLVSSIDV
ncbi:fibromodulin isoform X1 [Gambusia affinis]|uniref:fibromodulin isoform X1 n=2 Tax=Gambusia affinis TaxID=33528 RepID=UPI001CDD3A23|nr:fibromodulin isoform X1 [Gambusia affinis]